MRRRLLMTGTTCWCCSSGMVFSKSDTNWMKISLPVGAGLLINIWRASVLSLMESLTS